MYISEEAKLSRRDFRSIYAWFNGTIWQHLDCGSEVCSDAVCCGGYSEDVEHPRIYFLPGELEFLRFSLGHRLPMVEHAESRFHCEGSSGCVYSMRPVDCRSYPLWPKVLNSSLIGFYDCRGQRCPIRALPVEFIECIWAQWQRLLDGYPAIAKWLEESAPVSDALDWKEKEAWLGS